MSKRPLLIRPIPAPQSARVMDEAGARPPEPKHGALLTDYSGRLRIERAAQDFTCLQEPPCIPTASRSGDMRYDLCDERVRLAQVCWRYGSKATEHAFYCGLNCLSHKTPWAPSVPINVRHGCTPPSTSGHRCTKNYATSPLLASRRRCIRRKSHDGPGWRRPGNAWLILPIVFLAIRVLSTQGDLRSLPLTHLSRRAPGQEAGERLLHTHKHPISSTIIQYDAIHV